MRVDVEALKANVRISDVVRRSGVELTRDGNQWRGCCPFHGEKSPSFYVSDEKRGFKCFGCNARGSVVDFVMQRHGLSFLEAVAWLQGAAAHFPSQPIPAPAKRPDRDDSGLKLWDRSEPLAMRGRKAAAVIAYLTGRGIPAAADDWPSIRAAERPHPLTGPVEVHPVLVALITGPEGEPWSVQRTYLKECDGGRVVKLPVASSKMALGKPVKGGAIRIGGVASTIIVCEGLEDGLSLRVRYPDVPVWVACGASNVPAMEFPAEVSRIIIGADNDNTGRIEAGAAAKAFRSRGLGVEVIYPGEGFKDFNEELQAAEADAWAA